MFTPATSRPFVSSTLTATIVSMVAAWSVVSLASPPVSPIERPTVTQSKPSSSSGKHYYISPLPPGADWTAS